MTLTDSQELKRPLWAIAKASWQFFKGKLIKYLTKNNSYKRSMEDLPASIISGSCQIIGQACKYPCLLARVKFK